MGGYTQTTVRDALGNVVGYVPNEAIGGEYVSGGLTTTQATAIRNLWAEKGATPTELSGAGLTDYTNYENQLFKHVAANPASVRYNPSGFDTSNALGIAQMVAGATYKPPTETEGAKFVSSQAGRLDPSFEEKLKKQDLSGSFLTEGNIKELTKPFNPFNGLPSRQAPQTNSIREQPEAILGDSGEIGRDESGNPISIWRGDEKQVVSGNDIINSANSPSSSGVLDKTHNIIHGSSWSSEPATYPQKTNLFSGFMNRSDPLIERTKSNTTAYNEAPFYSKESGIPQKVSSWWTGLVNRPDPLYDSVQKYNASFNTTPQRGGGLNLPNTLVDPLEGYARGKYHQKKRRTPEMAILQGIGGISKPTSRRKQGSVNRAMRDEDDLVADIFGTSRPRQKKGAKLAGRKPGKNRDEEVDLAYEMFGFGRQQRNSSKNAGQKTKNRVKDIFSGI
jgi:hypothetical protein